LKTTIIHQPHKATYQITIPAEYHRAHSTIGINNTQTQGKFTTPKPNNIEQKHTLKSYPFIKGQSNTMATSNTANAEHDDNKQSPKPTSVTLLAIAKSISDKITKIKTVPTTPPYQTMPIKVVKTSSTMLNIPKFIPPMPTYDQEAHATTLCLPLMIRIAQTSFQHGTFNKTRILTAVLHSSQQTHPDCSISPKWNHDDSQPPNKKILRRATDIPDDHNIEHYLEQTDTTTSGQFRARILLNTNADIHTLKRSPQLIAWLKNENITIDRNPLAHSLKPQQIGFFTHFIVRSDKTQLYEHRTSSITTSKCPPFFLQAKHLQVSQAKTKVWNAYGDPNHLEEKTAELKNAFNNPTFHQIYSWKEYSSLQKTQQITILNFNNQFQTDFRSLMIPGFLTNDDNNIKVWNDDKNIQQNETTGEWTFTQTSSEENEMQDDDISDRFHNNINLTNINITDFIQQSFLSGDKTPVFAHVYEPIQGTQEVLVPTKHVPEALDLLKTIKV
jgi:hypothetical protein